MVVSPFLYTYRFRSAKDMLCNTIILSIAMLFWGFPLTALNAQSLKDDPEAKKVFEELDRRRDLVNYEKSEMQMIIYDNKGRTRERTMQSFSYDTEEESKSLTIFQAPADVRGTAFLSVREGSEEIQKLYLPALNSIQVISASQKSDRFMGSDFTYEDLGDQDPDEYTFEKLSETDSVTVLKGRKKEDSQYAYIHFYIDPDRYTLQKAEYYNEDGERIKRLVASNYEKVLVDEDVWRPGMMVMYDLENDRKTELKWTDRTINSSIASWRFTERGLRRGVQ